jgi:hypothetical protein
MQKFNNLKDGIKAKYQKFKDTILLKKTFTKLQIVENKYDELKNALTEKSFAHKFNDLLPSVATTSTADIILYCIVHFKGKDVYDVVVSHLAKNKIELMEHEIIEIATLVYEFIFLLDDLKLL